MGKIRSAIMTVIVVVVIVAATFFAVVSFPYGGGTYRWNSILSVIPLGSEFTGDAEGIIYPEGVITQAEYNLYTALPDPSDYDLDDEDEEKLYSDAVESAQDYADQYRQYGNLYIDAEEFDISYDEDTGEFDEDELDEIRQSVKDDASVIDDRLGMMGYSSYSVSIVNDFGIKIGVPTGYSYADLHHEDYLNDEDSSATKLSMLSSTVSALILQGELNICVSDRDYGGYDPSDSDLYDQGYYPITKKTDSISNYIKSVSKYSSGGSHALKFKLTSDGRELIFDRTNTLLDSDDSTLYFCIGSDVLMSLSIDSVIDSKKFYITVSDEVGAQSYAAVLDSVINGNVVTYKYSSEYAGSETISLAANTPQSGTYAALAMLLTALVVLIVLCVVSVAVYKKLGWVNVAMLLLFSLLMIYFTYLFEIEVTIVTMLCEMLCLGLFAGVNFVVFENVRSFVAEGNVIHNAVRNGYKKYRAGILDAHIVLLIATFVLWLVAKGALSSCGLIFMVGVIVSYVMYWFTRFMWYCWMSRADDKYKYCGYKRRVVDDED